ncbi:hypothetical protein Goarm_012321, partial [Gossypium armourianum]|nr:hypothetical protein [Gossypium armourianum]
MTPFNFDFEQHALTEEQMKELIYREALTFNPEYVQPFSDFGCCLPKNKSPKLNRQRHQQPPQQTVGLENFPAILRHGNRFIGYDIYGKIFEVTAKYKPPIEPIGMGGYGIV